MGSWCVDASTECRSGLGLPTRGPWTDPERVKVDREKKRVSTQPGEAAALGRLRGMGREWGGQDGVLSWGL